MPLSSRYINDLHTCRTDSPKLWWMFDELNWIKFESMSPGYRLDTLDCAWRGLITSPGQDNLTTKVEVKGRWLCGGEGEDSKRWWKVKIHGFLEADCIGHALLAVCLMLGSDVVQLIPLKVLRCLSQVQDIRCLSLSNVVLAWPATGRPCWTRWRRSWNVTSLKR